MRPSQPLRFELSRRRAARFLASGLMAITSITPTGCGMLGTKSKGTPKSNVSYHDNYGLNIEYPEVAQCNVPPQSLTAQQTIAPLTLDDPAQIPAFDMTLDQAVHLAVAQSPVLRSIGGTVVTAPQASVTTYDPALIAASPQLGTEAALAAFDAQYTQQLFWSNTDQPTNIFVPPGPFGFVVPVNTGRTATFNGELRKTTASGASFALRHVVNYDKTNQGGDFRRFDSTYGGWIEAEWRQPLLQGAGVTYNRIAGPSTIPGQYNGVLIARINEDVALADFEAAIVQLVADVEQAYWDLATAYRILDTTLKGRNAALKTFQYQKARVDVGKDQPDQEAQARSQYYQFQAQVEAALGGTAGLYAVEQRLRYLVGMPATDGRLLRPTTQPTDARVVFDWDSALGQSLDRRVEVRRQKMSVKRREMELVAARLNMRPRLDFLAQYRWVGLGNNLIGSTGAGTLDNLYAEITGGDYQEGQAGIEMNFPVGFRAAGVAIAHAKLNLQRERALLAETELRVSHDLSDAARQIALTHQLLETNFNRIQADQNQVEALESRFRAGRDNINFLLQAQRQAVISEAEFYRSLANYNLAIRDFHRQKGSLLAYNHVQLSEGPWAAGAVQDAYQTGRFLRPRHKPESTTAPAPLTSGPFDPSAVQDTSHVTPAHRAVEVEEPVAPELETDVQVDGTHDQEQLIGFGPSWHQ